MEVHDSQSVNRSMGTATASLTGFGLFMTAIGLVSVKTNGGILLYWEYSLLFAIGLLVIALCFLRAVIAKLQSERCELLRRHMRLQLEMEEHWRTQKDIFDITERDKNQIGQDLHDGVAQKLSGISFMCKTLQYKLAEKQLIEEKDVGQILEFLKSSIEDTQRVARGLLYPVENDKLELCTALEALAARKEKMFGIQCRCQLDASIQIQNDAMAKQIYQISQAGITNAVKNGRPNQVLLSMKLSDGQVVLTIEDNGIGIYNNDSAAQMRIRIMEYRAKMMGAHFSLDNHEEGGTRVRFSFQPEGAPLAEAIPFS